MSKYDHRASLEDISAGAYRMLVGAALLALALSYGHEIGFAASYVSDGKNGVARWPIFAALGAFIFLNGLVRLGFEFKAYRVCERERNR